jgi:hypothetical protein
MPRGMLEGRPRRNPFGRLDLPPSTAVQAERVLTRRTAPLAPFADDPRNAYRMRCPEALE